MFHGKQHRRSWHHAGLAAGWSDLVPGNQVTLLQNGEAYFPAIETAFDKRANYVPVV
jgi:cardiolipin synthase A/B